jgi:tetratricopeptide (TPR) repeat protein
MIGTRKRSEGARWDCVAIVFVAGALLCGLAGCGVEQAVDPEILLDPHGFSYESADLTPSRLEERMKDIDKAFEEPRSPGSVLLSFEKSRNSISHVNSYAALWRGTRACAWLAMNEPEHSRRKKFALEGISMGNAAARKVSNRAESYYYLALCQQALQDLRGIGFSEGLLQEIEKNLNLAIALDESLDHCGPHRQLGNLQAQVDRYPLLGIGGLDEALEHLKKSTEVCPEYGENHLAYAQLLIQAHQYDLARAQLEKVMDSRIPKDRSAEHEGWLTQATELLSNLQGK